jgi:protein TonB
MSLFKTIALSFAAHAAFVVGITVLKTPEPKKSESIGVMVSQKKKEKPKDEEKPKPIEAPPEVLHQRTMKMPAKAPEPAPPDPTPAPQHAALNAMPDFGISMTGTGGPGGIGIGVPVGPGGGSSKGVSQITAPPPKEKSFGSVKEAAQAESPCGEDMVKAKPLGVFNPPYTDEARSAEIEGRVKLKLSIDAQGNVTDVQVLSGLGHGLDESAIATARRMKFTPASNCGKAASSTFIVGASFRLGE